MEVMPVELVAEPGTLLSERVTETACKILATLSGTLQLWQKLVDAKLHHAEISVTKTFPT